MTGSPGKRVLMLLENCAYPQDARVRHEANALTKAGYRVSVICPAARGQPCRELVNGVQAYRYPPPPDGDGILGYLWEYAYSMAAVFLISIYVYLREGFDIIHAHNPPDTFAVIAGVYKLIGKKFVFDHHDLSPEMYNARFDGQGKPVIYNSLLFFEKLSFKLADHVITTNQSYKSIALVRGGVPLDRVTVVRNGPDLNRVYAVPADPELRKKAQHILGYVGLMGYQDGVDYLIRALARLKEDLGRTDFYCLIIGRGDAVKGLKSLTEQLDLGEHVWFTGRVSDDELMRYLSTTDICLDPDPSNPFNDRSSMIKMTEYMALGKPIVAFDLPEHRVTAQDAALYAQPNDELDFARKIVELMEDPVKRERMGRVGKERIDSMLSWSCQEQYLLSAYATQTEKKEAI